MLADQSRLSRRIMLSSSETFRAASSPFSWSCWSLISPYCCNVIGQAAMQVASLLQPGCNDVMGQWKCMVQRQAVPVHFIREMTKQRGAAKNRHCHDIYIYICCYPCSGGPRSDKQEMRTCAGGPCGSREAWPLPHFVRLMKCWHSWRELGSPGTSSTCLQQHASAACSA